MIEILLKVLGLVTNFLSAKSQSLSTQVINSLRKIIVFIIVSLGAMTLFCVGISLLVNHLAERMETNQPLIFNGTVGLGLSLSLLSLMVFIYCLSQKTWQQAVSNREEKKYIGPSPIEEALGLLIKDFVMERQLKRQEKTNPESSGV